jgi:hypothetical protein
MPTADSVELIAAVLTAGMLPKVEPLADSENITSEDAQRITTSVGHAVSLYAAVLEGLHSRTENPGPRSTAGTRRKRPD